MYTPHAKILTQLLNAKASGRVSHALLFSGKSGYASLLLAHAYAVELLSSADSFPTEKVQNFEHPDYHLIYPLAATVDYKAPSSLDLLPQWRQFFKQSPYESLQDWVTFLGIEKKQASIKVDSAKDILHALTLQSYAGGYRVVLIWLPETMNQETANKLLKVVEEPPASTVFLLVSEDAELLLPTLRSRCQQVSVPPLSTVEMSELLQHFTQHTKEEIATVLPFSKGDVQVALQWIEHKDEELEHFFIEWVRNAFRARKEASALKELYQWAMQLSQWNRGKQLYFLHFCTEVFRLAVLNTYGARELSHPAISVANFKWDRFASFIHGANVEDILEELNQASYHIQRNANAKIVFLDLGIKLTRLIHRKLD